MATSVIYPAGVAQALGHLHTSHNEIQIFIEDTANRNIWRNILKKFLPNDVEFSDPIPLGGREKVIRECRLDQADDGRKKLYIIDADLDLLKGRCKPRLKHLYRLRSYCIENYLAQEDALVKVAQVLNTNVSDIDARNRLDLNSWKQRNELEFRQLFCCYATIHSLDDRIKTVGYWIGNLTQAQPAIDELCPVKTRRRVRGLFRSIRANSSREIVRETYTYISKNADDLDYFRYASGKDGVLKQLIVRLKRLFGNMHDDQITVLLSDYMSPDIDPYLKRRLHSICSQ